MKEYLQNKERKGALRTLWDIYDRTFCGSGLRLKIVNPLMSGGKRYTYLNKPAAKSCRFV